MSISESMPMWQAGPTHAEYEAIASKHGGWIPIEEMQPPSGMKVLTSAPRGFEVDEYAKGYGRFIQDWESAISVTHWQKIWGPS